MTDGYSPDIAGYPFPFWKDEYRFSTLVEPGGTLHRTAAGGWGDYLVWVEPSAYRRYTTLRTGLIAEDPQTYDLAEHMHPAGWDATVYLMRHMAARYPEHFELRGEYPDLVWENRLLGIVQPFRVGDRSTLPSDPLAYLGCQVTEDFLLLDQRDGELWLEGGVLAFLWSVPFTRGMSFRDLHTLVPRMTDEGVTERTEKFIMRMEPGDVYRRTAWLFQAGDWLALAKEAPGRLSGAGGSGLDTLDEIGSTIHLRSELQHIIRLPETGALLFLLGSRMLSLERLTSVPEWTRRTLSVVETLADDITDYKSVAPLREPLLRYLRHRVVT